MTGVAERVLVVGLDGATWDLIGPWADGNLLPTLSALMREGAHGRIRSVMPPLTAPAWSSFYTGANPGKHGIYDFYHRLPGTYQTYPYNASHRKLPSIFRLVSRNGLRTIAVNPPLMYPAEDVNGYLIPGLGVPPGAARGTFPADLHAEVTRQLGFEWPLAFSEPDIPVNRQFVEKAAEYVNQSFRMLEYLMAKDPDWRFAFLQLQSTDTVLHRLWRFMDRYHPDHDPSAPASLKGAILSHYRQVDRMLDRLVHTLPRNTALLIMSDHGHGPSHGTLNTNLWLLERGWLVLKPDATTKLKHAAFRLGMTPSRFAAMLKVARSSRRFRQRSPGLSRKSRSVFLSFRDIDWRRSRAYALGEYGAVYLNLQGREPQGAVRPGEYERTLTELSHELMDFQSPEWPGKLVTSVIPGSETHWGPYAADGPDLFYLTDQMLVDGTGGSIFLSNKPLFKGNSMLGISNRVSGHHRLEGIGVLWGPSVRTGVELSGSIMDLTPTLLAMLGLPIPAYMDGQVLASALDEELFESRPLSFAESDEAPTSSLELTEEEARAVSERLAALGYLSE